MPDDEPDPAQPPQRRAAAPSRRGRRRPAPRVPQPKIVAGRRWNVSLVWLLPSVAVAIGASLLVRSVFLVGPRIDIEFATAEGHRGRQDRGPLQGGGDRQGANPVSLRDDRKGVVVGVRLDRSAAGFAVAGHQLLGRAAADRPGRRQRARHAALRRLHRHRRGRLDQGASRVQGPRGAALRAARRAGQDLRAARLRPRLARRRLAGVLSPHAGRPGRRLHARRRARRAVGPQSSSRRRTSGW